MAYKQFDKVPNHYAGPIIQQIKEFRSNHGKRTLAPTVLQVGELSLLIPRHFGFCFGVERAIHMAFSTVDKRKDERTFLVSEIIHNPLVNRELEERGIEFIYDANGQRRIDADSLKSDDIVMIPAFGTTKEIENSLQISGINTKDKSYRENYDTTCPFVSKVWKRGEDLGREGYTIIIHGKFFHEETQATNSHTKNHAKTLVVYDCKEAHQLAKYIKGEINSEEFNRIFDGKSSDGFDPELDLQRVAVVNQTTMLAAETQKVTEILREAMRRRYGNDELDYRCADTNDTLCYATNQNQNATQAVLQSKADLALIVGGYNSSNTSHLVEICAEFMPSYLISNSDEIISRDEIKHFDVDKKELVSGFSWLPDRRPLSVVVTSGASCPDILMNQVIDRLVGFFGYGKEDVDKGLTTLKLLGED
mgnify:FL=1